MAASIQQRRESILSLLYQDGHVEVSRLTETLRVSEATVRRDLRQLEREGLAQVSHGGASVPRSSGFSYMARAMRNVEAKRVIGRLAGDLVADEDQLFIDSGTTCFAMTKYLRARRGLSVIVNSVRTAQELDAPGMRVILLGGQYRPERMDAVGPLASSTLERLRGYRAFIGCDGLGMEFGPTAVDIESASIFGQAVRNAREAVMLVDETKFNHPSLYRIEEWKRFGTVVTNREPGEAWRSFFEGEGIRLIVPEEPAGEASATARAGHETR